MSVLSLRSAVGTLLLVGGARVALAQQLWAPFVGLSSTPPAGPLWGGSSLVLEPGARFESTRGSLLARWGTTFEQQTPKFDNADLSARTVLTRGDRFETGLFAAGQYDRGYLRGGPSSNERLRLQFGSASPTSGFQVGVGADGWRLNTGGTVAPASTVSGWIRRFGLTFSAEASAGMLSTTTHIYGDSVVLDTAVYNAALRRGDTLRGDRLPYIHNPNADRGTVNKLRSFGDGRLRVSGAFMSVGIDGEAGVTFAAEGASRGFGSLIFTRWLTPAFALTGGIVIQPAAPGAAERRGAIVGVRLARSPRMIPRFVNAPKAAIATCTVRYTESGVTVELAAPGANHVELSGDFTKWQPVVLDHRTGDRWTITSAISPGVHHLLVRVDGGSWMPPPGLPQATDLYEGTVGVLVAPEPVMTHQH
jgi:hypothetical protein